MNAREKIRDWLALLLVVVLLPIILPLILVLITFRGIRRCWLLLQVRARWYPRGRRVLLVYSDSPNWKEYFETAILPRLGDTAIVINWSQRAAWARMTRSLELRLFDHFAGSSLLPLSFWPTNKVRWDANVMGREFNPLAIVFVPWWKPKVLRFWRALKEWKHGEKQRLRDLEAKLFQILSHD